MELRGSRTGVRNVNGLYLMIVCGYVYVCVMGWRRKFINNGTARKQSWCEECKWVLLNDCVWL